MAKTNIDKQTFGEAGATVLSGTEGVVKNICAILIIEDTIFDGNDNDTDKDIDGDCTIWRGLTESGVVAKQLLRVADANGVTVPAGITIYGQFEAVKLRSGTVLCYHSA